MDSEIELVINNVVTNVTLEKDGQQELVIDVMFMTKRRGQAVSTPTSRFRLRTVQAKDLHQQLTQALDNLSRGGFPHSPEPKH